MGQGGLVPLTTTSPLGNVVALGLGSAQGRSERTHHPQVSPGKWHLQETSLIPDEPAIPLPGRCLEGRGRPGKGGGMLPTLYPTRVLSYRWGSSHSTMKYQSHNQAFDLRPMFHFESQVTCSKHTASHV